MPASPTNRARARLLTLLLAVLSAGCGESDLGTIDLAKSRAVAEEKGVFRQPVPAKDARPRRGRRNSTILAGPPSRATPRDSDR